MGGTVHRLTQTLLPLLLTAAMLTSAAATAGEQRPAKPVRLSESELIAALKKELDKRVAAEQFSGAVLIAKTGKPIFQQAYGYADREKKIPNTLDTKFRHGSMSKMFTAVAIAQLVQAGKMRFEDPISKYLPDYPNKSVAAVTIHQALTHTGGTGNIFGPQFDAHRLELKTHQDYVDLFGTREVAFPPGSRWEYSNYGMVLLGRIIEVVTGQSYYDYVRERIFMPVGMTSTGSEPEEARVPGLSIPYTRLEPGRPPRPLGPNDPLPTGPLRSAADELPYRGTAAGGGYSTVGDFLKFATALTSNKLLNERYTELVTTGKVETGRGREKYAYGFVERYTPDGVRSFGHGGGAPGMNGSLSIYPDSEYVVVVLANMDPPAAQQVAEFIERRLPFE